MTCFEEHLGKLEDIFESPQDVNCVRRVRQLAKVPVSLLLLPI